MAELGKIPVEKRLQCPECQSQFTGWQLPGAENFRCPQCRCWLRLPTPQRPQPARLDCPVCSGTLQPYRCPKTDLELDGCADCGGLWFDRDELQKVMTTPGLLQDLHLPSPRLQPAGSGARQCLRCADKPLKQYQLGQVEVDACTTCHGTWLDGGELERLMAQRDPLPERSLADQLLAVFRAVFKRE